MKKLYIFVFFLVLYSFSTNASDDMIMPGMLKVIHEFHAPARMVSMSLTMYILGNSALQLFVGPLAERFGKKKMILIGSFLFMAFTSILIVAHNIYEFMLGRFLQGSGLAFLAMGYALIQESFNDKKAVKVFALMSIVGIISPLVGPIVGSILIHKMGWRHIFMFTGILALIAFVGLCVFTPRSTRPPTPLNIREIVKTYIRVITTPRFIYGTICCSISYLPIICWLGLAPILVMKTLKLSMLSYALCQAIIVSGLTLSMIVMHFIAGKISFYRQIKFGSIIAFLGLAIGHMFYRDFDARLGIVIFGLFIYGFGLGLFNPLIFRIVVTTPDIPKSVLTSLFVLVQILIVVLGLEVTSHICNIYGYSLRSFTLINLVIGCISILLVRWYAYYNRFKKWE